MFCILFISGILHKIIIIFDNFPRVESSKLHSILCHLFLFKGMLHLTLYTTKTPLFSYMWDKNNEEKSKFNKAGRN
jgi:hypothetical protein